MTVYFLIFCGLGVMGILYYKVMSKKIALTWMLIIFWLSTLRSSQIGTDYKTYIYVFHSQSRMYGWGYNLLNYVASLLGDSYVCLAFTVNLLIFGATWKVYEKEIERKYLLFALAIWTLNPYCFMASSMNIMRQGCAMACILIAIFAISNKKRYFLIFLLVILAGSFHKSAYVYILLFPFQWIHWKRRYHAIMLCMCTILNLVLGKEIIRPVAELLDYTVYLESYGTTAFDTLYFMLLVFLVSIYLIYRYPILYNNKKEKWYVDFYLFFLNLLLLLVKNDIAYRMYIYASFVAPIAISYMLENLKRKLVKGREHMFMKIGYMGYYAALYWMYLLTQIKSTDVIPFRFFNQ